MIEKLEKHIIGENAPGTVSLMVAPTAEQQVDKINELVDAVNAIQKEREAERFEIQEWVGIVSDLRSRVPVVESRVSILEEHAHPTATTEPADPYAEQRKWIGKLCRFWDEKEEEKVFGILTTIDSDCGLSDMCPYWNDTTKNWFEHCEPVKDDIIYKGSDNDAKLKLENRFLTDVKERL